MKGQFEIFKKLCMIKNNLLAISACTFLITFPYVAGDFQTNQIMQINFHSHENEFNLCE